MDCDVGIVGGGLAGLYMAESLLRHKKETKVCVFERDTRLGGRIYDYFFPQVPDESVGSWDSFESDTFFTATSRKGLSLWQSSN